ncbi:MAG TPA: SLBB domain-containing protein, partial [Planctomycetaceae bacterium]|nr:SLBB domain-containing protein [Planctomycetaceae bacterium]
RLVAGFTIGLLTVWLSGCTLFQAQQVATAQNSAFAWLTKWGGQPLDVAPGFDVEALRPQPRPPVVDTGDLLEITIWDLYEPGKPYTFPVRVSDQRVIDVPFLGEFVVTDRTIPQIESGLCDGYRTAEYLVQPRVLVRSLDPPTVKVQVGGAVQRPGFVELSRADTSVYAALISAGGLKKSAGTQVSVERRSQRSAVESPLGAPEVVGNQPGQVSSASKPSTPEQRANTAEILSVEPVRPQGLSGTPQANVNNESSAEQSEIGPSAAVWYDLTKPDERDALRSLALGDGDEIIVKAAVLPVRIGGVVNHPGAFPLPTGRTINLWQAIDLAGGVGPRDVPLNITLIRPAAERRPAQRWSVNVAEYDRHPATSPMVEPGDVVHVEPTAGSRIKRAVGGLWNKP